MIIDRSADMSSSRRSRSPTDDDDDNRETYMQMIKKKMKMTMCSSSSSTSLFSLLTEDLVVEEILLKLPVDSLLSLRRVSKYFHSLITSPSFVRKHLHLSSTAQFHRGQFILISSCILGLSHHQQVDGKLALKMVFFNRACNFSSSSSSSSSSTGDDHHDPSRPEVLPMHCPLDSVGVQGSCNGLLFLHGWTHNNKKPPVPPGYIWNPCTKEYKEILPPSLIDDDLFEGIETSSCAAAGRSSSGYCGFGYDRTNDEYKILYHENRVGFLPGDDYVPDPDPDPNHESDDDNAVSITEFKLYKLRTNTWTRISSNPYRSLFFEPLFARQWKRRTGLLVNGDLHWLMSSSPSSLNYAKNAKIISFDMEKEEFREVQKPHYSTAEEEDGYCYGSLQVLKGCLCLSQLSTLNQVVDILMLKDYAVINNSWTKLFTVATVNSDPFYYIMNYKLLTFCENGEIVMFRGPKDLIVYDPVTQKVTSVEELGKALQKGEITQVLTYIESLVSLNSGTYMAPPPESQWHPQPRGECMEDVSSPRS